MEGIRVINRLIDTADCSFLLETLSSLGFQDGFLLSILCWFIIHVSDLLALMCRGLTPQMISSSLMVLNR